MDTKALEKFSYGLYVLTARDGVKDNGCIIDTAIQAAFTPDQISICVNKDHFTRDMILKTKKFTISVLSQDVPFELIKHFGFYSGAKMDKFADFKDCKRGENDIYYITKGTNAFLSVHVDQTLELGSHTLFVGKVTEMKVLNDKPSVTYEYYLNHIKPEEQETDKQEDGKTVWRCRTCGYEYVGAEIPEDFICPVCKNPASGFEKIVRKES